MRSRPSRRSFLSSERRLPADPETGNLQSGRRRTSSCSRSLNRTEHGVRATGAPNLREGSPAWRGGGGFFALLMATKAARQIFLGGSLFPSSARRGRLLRCASTASRNVCRRGSKRPSSCLACRRETARSGTYLRTTTTRGRGRSLPQAERNSIPFIFYLPPYLFFFFFFPA